MKQEKNPIAIAKMSPELKAYLEAKAELVQKYGVKFPEWMAA